ncbi:hypothetical protein LTR56_019731 [Elasticomyces elasticus]|nr:hypothetical protein LTR56_019731 [Elasticomyces elasticus]KAK3655799.1 hypothetical protein LTR22_010093 [Elasticomyces elasticus]KAK4925861.1 hypothetical protein LTR49_007238 [Elasticomyces elasticus]KAK5764816.1 hypothetical protein LTS12_005086 [Elasticomyces elasticus]
MVQYQRKGLYRGDPEGARNHLKLKTHHHLNITAIMNLLAERKVNYNKSSGKQRLLTLVSRSECGLRSYERNNKRELRQICHARNLALETPQTANKADLIALLEAADDAIYKYHFEDFEQGSIIVAPPITAACRLIRDEARPLFYSTHQFDLETNFHDCTFSLLTTSLVKLLPASAFALIRKLRFAGNVPCTIRSVLEFTTIECELDLGGEYTAARVEKLTGSRLYLGYSGGLTAAQIAMVNLRISRVLSDMSTRSKGKALRRGDISTLCDALMLLA